MNVKNFHLLPMGNLINGRWLHSIRAEFNTEAVPDIFALWTVTIRLGFVKDIDAAKLSSKIDIGSPRKLDIDEGRERRNLKVSRRVVNAKTSGRVRDGRAERIILGYQHKAGQQDPKQIELTPS